MVRVEEKYKFVGCLILAQKSPCKSFNHNWVFQYEKKKLYPKK